MHGRRKVSPIVSVLFVSVALGACNDGAQISVTYQNDVIVPRAQTTVTLFDGRRRYVVKGADLLPDMTKNDWQRATATSGELVADISMRDAQGVIATGQVTLALKSDWIWGINLHVDSVNPSRYCFGCFGSRSFPLRAGVGRTVRDSLWVTWGGNSISNPVVY